MDEKQRIVVENKIDYQFKNKSLLQQAFVRSSYTAENGGWDNEVLEFIGDKVIDFVVTKMLAEKYCHMTMSQEYRQKRMWKSPMIKPEPNVLHSDKNEGELTEIRKSLVQRANLARRIDEYDFSQYLVMSKSDEVNHVYENASVKEDLFEAIVGAVAIDCNWNTEKLEQVVDHMLEPDLEEFGENYIMIIQEWSLKKYNELPMYHVDKFSQSRKYQKGYIYDSSAVFTFGAQPTYTAYLGLKGIEDIVLGFGFTQREARKDAARCACKLIEKMGLLFTIKDEIDNPNLDDAINQLETLARRGYFSLPEYVYEESHDENGNPIWHVRCLIEGQEYSSEAIGSVKKQAKKQAAYNMLMYVLG